MSKGSLTFWSISPSTLPRCAAMLQVTRPHGQGSQSLTLLECQPLLCLIMAEVQQP